MTELAVHLTDEARATHDKLRRAAKASLASRKRKKKPKASKQEGLYKQVAKTIALLANPCHPGLQTHEYHSLTSPFDSSAKVFEAYVQQKTPGAYRVFWCYGPNKREITVIAITPHP